MGWHELILTPINIIMDLHVILFQYDKINSEWMVNWGSLFGINKAGIFLPFDFIVLNVFGKMATMYAKKKINSGMPIGTLP